MTGTKPVRITLQEKIYSRIHDDILVGALIPGEQLRVAHLAHRFGTSQAPVREALRRLTEEGLTTTVPFHGSILKKPTWDEIKDIYLLREELEALAVRRILSRPPVDLQAIRQAQKNLERAVSSGDTVAVLDADLEFHRSVCMAASSDLTLEVWTTIIKRFRGARMILARRHIDDLSTVVLSHQVLVSALEDGDTQIAEAAFREHLRSALEGIERIHFS